MAQPGALPIRHLPATPEGARHRYTTRVYFEDTDAGGVVYHANYLRFAERARTEWLRELGVPHAELVASHGRMFVVQRIEMEYARPARLDDLLTVVTDTAFVGGASVVLRQAFWRGEDGKMERLGVLTVRLACVAPGSTRPERIPNRWRAALELAHAPRTGERHGQAGGVAGA